MTIIDRRLNPQGRSLANRQRFLRRARAHIKKAVEDVASRRGIQDIESGDTIAIPLDGIEEPSFRHASRSGRREIVLPGNHDFVEGDRIQRPSGGAGAGRRGSPDGEGEDSFRFVLSREEFLDIFLDDLELPDLDKHRNKQTPVTTPMLAGFTISGAPANLNVIRTLRNSLARRTALRRPRPAEIEALGQEIAALEAAGADADPDLLAECRARLALLERRSRLIPFVDPIDVRYNRFQQVPRPIAQAVMFCLMDVSGSMTESMKDLAKRFFILLYLFLRRRYQAVEVVFIRHSHQAREVDEQTFFYGTETGGTVVSTALEEMRRVLNERFPSAEWNIYGAQASDGDNLISDNAHTAELLTDVILPQCQYYAYLEVASEHEHATGLHGRPSDLWRVYEHIAQQDPVLALRRVHAAKDIVPVFRDLFMPRRAKATA